MLRSYPAFEVASVECGATVADHVHVLRDAFLQTSSGHDDLERRSGGELSLNSFVKQRMIVVVDQLAPLIAGDSNGKIVGIKSRAANHGQDLPIARVHGYDCTILVAQSLFCSNLQIEVDGQLELPA